MASKPTRVLEDFAQLAYEFSINLDGRVQLLPGCWCKGGQAIVYKGSLLPEGVEVAVKIASSSLPADETRKIIKVRMLKMWLPSVTFSRVLSGKSTPGLNYITRTFSRFLASPRSLIARFPLYLHGWKREMRMSMFKIKKLILALWCVAVLTYEWYLHHTQIEGIARGLHYLHDYKPGSIFHGYLKGVGIFSLCASRFDKLCRPMY